MDRIKCGCVEISKEIESDSSFISTSIDVSEFENPIILATIHKEDLDTLPLVVETCTEANDTVTICISTPDKTTIPVGVYYANYLITEACE